MEDLTVEEKHAIIDAVDGFINEDVVCRLMPLGRLMSLLCYLGIIGELQSYRDFVREVDNETSPEHRLMNELMDIGIKKNSSGNE